MGEQNKKQVKILFISPHFYSFKESNSGSEQRTRLLLRACAQQGRVDLVMFHGSEGLEEMPNCNVIYNKTIENKDEIKNSRYKKWRPIVRFWDKAALFTINEEKQTIVGSFLKAKNYDLIVTRYIPKAMECGLLAYADKLIVDVDDLPIDYYKMLAKNSQTFSSKFRNVLFSIIARWHTRTIIRKVKKTSFPNPTQALQYDAVYLPNIPFYDYQCDVVDFGETSKRLLFVGNLYHEPNSIGLEHFLKYVYVPLRTRDKSVEFHIVGGISEDLKTRWENCYQGILILGFVNDLKAEYEESRVVVAPIYHGAGTNIKVIEAMRMNRTCVVSKFATRGFSSVFEDGKDYFVAHSDNEYILLLEQLLTNEVLNKQTAYNGYQKAKETYSFETFTGIVEQML